MGIATVGGDPPAANRAGTPFTKNRINTVPMKNMITMGKLPHHIVVSEPQ
jgi:hypothetical protein